MNTLFRLLPLLALISLPLAAVEQEEVFSQAELDQMLAPIALYPDSLLAQILTASTYPLEVVEAARWSKTNPDLEGAAAVDAVEDQEWDPSVKALVAFPDVLKRMDEDLDWMRRLGDAVLQQEEEVMSSVQELRQKAYAAGSLDSIENVRVRTEREVIYIEPAEPQIVYVPYYRPTVVYGTWWWPTHPPVYWGPPATVYYSSSGSSRFIWTSGIHISTGFFYSQPDWHRRHIVVHHHHHSPAVRHTASRDWGRYNTGDRWRHEPSHRRGVTYRNKEVHEKYSRSAAPVTVVRSGDSERRSIRYAPRDTDRASRLQTAASRAGTPQRSVGDKFTRERTASADTARGGLSTPARSARESAAAASENDRSNLRTFAAPSEEKSATIRSSPDRRESIAARLSSDRPATESFRSRGSPSPAPRVESREVTVSRRGNSSNIRTFSAPSGAKVARERPSIGVRAERAPARIREAQPAAPRVQSPAPRVQERAPAPRVSERNTTHLSRISSSGPPAESKPPAAAPAAKPKRSSAREAARSLGK